MIEVMVGVREIYNARQTTLGATCTAMHARPRILNVDAVHGALAWHLNQIPAVSHTAAIIFTCHAMLVVPAAAQSGQSNLFKSATKSSTSCCLRESACHFVSH